MYKSIASRCFATVLCVIMILLAGCGFHLRVLTILSPEVKTLSIKSKNSDDFVYVLKKTLQNSGVSISDSAPYQVIIHDFHISSVNQIQATTNVANYTLTGTVKWELQTKSGLPLFLPRTLSQNISYQVAKNININDTSSAVARDNLKHAMASSIVRQIGAITPDQLKKWRFDAERRQSLQNNGNLPSDKTDISKNQDKMSH